MSAHVEYEPIYLGSYALTAPKEVFTMTDSTTGADTPNLAVTAVISKDGSPTFSATANSIFELSGGWYAITLTNTEMTANNIALKFTATGAVTRDIMLQTQP